MEGHKKTAVITGGATGIGRAIGMKLAERGANIVLNYAHSEQEARAAAMLMEERGAEVLLIQADVSKEEDVKRMIEWTVEQFGGIHYLVNNASITKQLELSDLEAVTDECWDQIMAVNVKGMFSCARAAAPFLKREEGSAILNMGSIAGLTGSGSSLPYAVSKAAVHGLTKSLAHALAPAIRVNALAPAAVATRWWQGEEEKMLRLSGHLPLQRLSTPEDIAELACAILVQESLTGQIISPNNGMLI
ncbi:SDR family NAD(P)-dependent oxidoreductase [Gorillibacterium timonense]|uniref:SDR family NAD(P)-dependent oxidoreductase n=1 Tax=Gorillibacterium timonense TaxID=1689269 RepID=UPI00071CA1D7|nr:SDR family oxidoreductase [Gorillibacterium timonense]